MITICHDPNFISDVFFRELVLLYEPFFEHDIQIDAEKFFDGIRVSYGSHSVCVPLREDHYGKTTKYALYCLLSELTGISLPWGSLLGVKPLRKYQQLLCELRDETAVKGYMQRTYDVSDSKMELLRVANSVQESYAKDDRGSASLYVHVPICVSKCSYCSFPSAVSEQGSALCEEYLGALLYEYAQLDAYLRERNVSIDAVYFGGGTPSVFSAEQLERLFSALQERMREAGEITFEAGRTDTISKEKLEVLHRAGMTRISLNPQTTRDETLAKINRKTDFQSFLTCYETAREIGFDIVNCDLIFGLEGESREDFARSLSDVIALEPENITLHTLCAKRTAETEHAQIVAKHIDVSTFHDAAREILKSHGYEPYYLYKQKYAVSGAENVGYAKRGKACVYNMRMMGDGYPIYSIGANASAKIVQEGTDQYRNVYQVKDLRYYLSNIETLSHRKIEEMKQLEQHFAKEVPNR